jgi:PAS domain S-box-containing protein
MEEQEINRYWRRIINTMNDGLMLIGPDGSILMVNHAFEQLTGYAAEEVIGLPCTLLKCDACEKTVTNEEGYTWCRLFEEGQKDVKRCRCMVLKKDGTWLTALKNASVLRDDRGEAIGAVETITDISELDRLDKQVDQLSRQLDTEDGFCGMVGKSPVIRKVFEVVKKAAQSDAPVIVYGESGTGKELVAQAIHRCGRRSEGPFVQLNCAALNASLLESELFGHIKGAFTGAFRHRIGRFEAADSGDIFLDEIGDVPLSLQVKLLRVIETGRFERVGDHRSMSADVRIITATNQNLQELIAQKTFREDLFFRINVIPIHLPPLRDRREDIPLMVGRFIRRLSHTTGKRITGVDHEAMEHLMSYHWPGNVRELKSTLEYAFVIAEDGQIRPEELPPGINAGQAPPGVKTVKGSAADPAEKSALIDALRQCGGNQTQAAKFLGVNRVTVWNRMRKYGIDLKKVLVE